MERLVVMVVRGSSDEAYAKTMSTHVDSTEAVSWTKIKETSVGTVDFESASEQE
jgi:hypothetical protein